LWVEIAETKKEIQKWELEDNLNFAGVLLSIGFGIGVRPELVCCGISAVELCIFYKQKKGKR
jgi:hypothetical protein